MVTSPAWNSGKKPAKWWSISRRSNVFAVFVVSTFRIRSATSLWIWKLSYPHDRRVPSMLSDSSEISCTIHATPVNIHNCHNMLKHLKVSIKILKDSWATMHPRIHRSWNPWLPAVSARSAQQLCHPASLHDMSPWLEPEQQSSFFLCVAGLWCFPPLPPNVFGSDVNR